ncbi:MAG: rhomboid family intramembrane serine protease [Verrucomicrobiota bacterium]|nr:rhomboid family intramembrane serine protease [Verrucomicrobiota bacterium]
MTFLDKLERRIGFIAIPGLIRIVVAFTALVYVLTFLNTDIFSILELNPARIRHGEVWRLLTYIFIPRGTGTHSMLQPLWVVFALQITWFIGELVEHAWGAFRFTLYVLVGMIGTTAAAFLFGAQFSNVMLALSVLFACAWFCPDEIIYVMFIIPMKIKWLAWIAAAFVTLGAFGAPFSYKMAAVTALANYFLFFGPEIFHQLRHRQEVSTRRNRFEMQTRPDTESLHRCKTCGRTELTDPDLEFRVSRDGEEYCMEHLPSAAPATTR